jgi:transcription-repair coupling factor (superfamily II helicase)
LILQFLQKATNKAKLKQVGKHGILEVQSVETMSDLYGFLKKMHGFVVEGQEETA